MRLSILIFLILSFYSFAEEGYPDDTLWYNEDGRLKDEFVVEDIRFQLGSWELIEKDNYFDSVFAQNMFLKLDSLAEAIKLDSGLFEIQHHRDSRGSNMSSRCLTCKRAEALRNYLILCGVQEDNIFAKGYGESTPRLATLGENTFKLTEEFINKFRKTDKEKFERYHQLNRRLVVKRL